MRTKQLTLEQKKIQLADCEQNFNDVTEQLRVEGDAPRKNQQKAQLKELGKQMEQLERDIEDLEYEIQQEKTKAHIYTLCHILQAHEESQFLGMLTEYKRMLANRKYSLNPEPKTSQEIVTELLRIPKGQSRYNSIEEFVALLVVSRLQDSLDLLVSLQNWGQQYVEDWSNVTKSVENEKQQVQNAQPAILVAVSRSDEASTQEQEINLYQVKAWLIEDMDRYKQEPKPPQSYRPFGLPEWTGEETYSLKELIENIPQLVMQFQKDESDRFNNDPEIHIFLPLELINQDVDCWPLKNENGKSRPLGHQYKVVLRCAERLGRSYQQRSLWRRKWQQHQSLLQKLAFTGFVPGDDNSDLDDLYYDLTDDVENTVVGLKVTQAPSQVGNDSLFSILLESGLPLAIWGRCNLREATNADELDRVLQACCLEQLPKTVKEQRRDSRKKARDCHIGHHLSLLWDDPELVPPKST